MKNSIKALAVMVLCISIQLLVFTGCSHTYYKADFIVEITFTDGEFAIMDISRTGYKEDISLRLNRTGCIESYVDEVGGTHTEIEMCGVRTFKVVSKTVNPK